MKLSARQLKLIRSAAASLPILAREGFLIDLAQRLADHPSDNAVVEAINVALDRASSPRPTCAMRNRGTSKS